MDTAGSFDAAAEEWLWSLEWLKAGEPGQDWAGVIKCLRDSAELGGRWKDDDCAAWADLIEALVGDCRAEPGIDRPANARSAMVPAESH
jgi:hypothetical protein